MQFHKTVNDQLSALKTKNPAKDYQSLGNEPEIIAREYRREFVKPYLTQLIDLSVCAAGRPDADKYEEAAVEVINQTLAIELTGKAVHHAPSLRLDNYKRNIRDITFAVPSTDLGTQWNTIIMQHDLRSIVFECKNYGQGNHLTSQEIYQLYEYMNPLQHGKLGVLLCRYGRRNLSPDANSAIDRISKDGYRILILGDDEVREWIEEFIETGSSVNSFYTQIDISRSDPK